MSGDNDTSMTAAFLRHVLPSEGWYACFILESKRHLWFNDFEKLAVSIIASDRSGQTTYHGCAAYQTNGRRNQESVLGARSFWLDIDLAPKSKYADVQSAAEAVAEFCVATHLPSPVYVGSGHGLHVYWVLELCLERATWLRYAHGLKQLCVKHGLEAGPERTADIASILRTPGTHNRKNGDAQLVQCGPLVGPYGLDAFGGLLDGELQQVPTQRPVRKVESTKRNLAANLGNTFEDEPRYGAVIVDQCGALAHLRETRGTLPEPYWYAALGVLAFCVDGQELGHQWSSGFDGYTAEETQERLARARKLTGATTCEKFHSLDARTCEACPHWGKIKSPISLGWPHNREAENTLASTGEEKAFQGIFDDRPNSQRVDDLPPLPHDFYWSPRRELISKSESARGGIVDIVVSTFPIFLDSVQTGEVRGEWTFIFKQFIPERGWFDIPIPASVLFGSQASSELASRGANVHEHAHFIRYSRAAIDLHYRTGKLTTRYDQFGWKADDAAFLYGLDLYSAQGVTRVVGNDELQTRCREDWVGPCKGGDLEVWKQTINALFASGCEPQSVALLSAFAAPLIRFQERDEGGAIIHLVTRESGTGKSTALIGAASVWGRREGLGLTNDDTRVSKALTLGALGNLPVIYDEMTVRDPDAIRAFVINFTNGRDKMRATRSGEIKHTASTWQTIMISAANTSLVDVLSAQNMPEAPSYRILEFQLEVPAGIRHVQGDKLRKALRNNSGYAGAVYLAWLIKPENLAWTKATLEKVTQQTWLRTGWKSEHRFWVRTIAAIAVAGVIVKKLGLVDFSIERIMEWLFEHVGGGDVAQVNVPWGINALAEFLNLNRDATLVVEKAYVRGERQRPIMEPRARLAIRYERSSGRYLVSQTALREWLIAREQSYQEMVRALEIAGIVTRKRCQATLGAGTDVPGGQVWCLEVDGAHVLLGEVAPVSDNVVPLAKALGR